MREIKFRGKRVDNGEWVYGVPIPNSYGERVFIIPLLLTDKIAYPFERLVDWVIEVRPETVGQYTGLTVSNGELYFGDIVKWKDGADGYSLAVIEWDDKRVKVIFRAFYTTGVDDSEDDGFFEVEDFNSIEHFEVIGNTHDNPELLEMENV